MQEYRFELRLCAHLEATTDTIIARQLGGGVTDTGGRIYDIVTIEPGPEFAQRREITHRSIPALAIESAVGPGRASPWPGTLDVSPAFAERVKERAIEVGFFELVPHHGTAKVRQSTAYPDWIGAITAIENKPTLERPGALRMQLRRDVSLGLVDRVILATASHVTGAHLNRIPPGVGVWRVEHDAGAVSIEVIREPTPLDPDQWGIEIGGHSPTARRIDTVSPEAKSRARVRLAERAYGKGWRTPLPGCERATTTTVAGTDTLPFCTWKDSIVDPAGCNDSCPAYDPGQPPAADLDAERAARTPWTHDPAGVARRQAGLFAEWE